MTSLSQTVKRQTTGRGSTQKPGPDRSKGTLSDVLAAQRQRTEDAWFAATTEMQNEAWLAGRDKDRRVSAQKHEPERRRCVITP
jgi:hypothetical protein